MRVVVVVDWKRRHVSALLLIDVEKRVKENVSQAPFRSCNKTKTS